MLNYTDEKGEVAIEGYEIIIEDCCWICVAEFVWLNLCGPNWKKNTAVKYPGKFNTYLTNNETIIKRTECEK